MAEPADTGGAGAEEPAERRLPVRASEVEPARGEVVDAPRGLLERLASGPLAAPALAAAGGFVIGFLTFMTARLLRGRGGQRFASRARRRAIERQIESSRSFLVDVHVLRR
jgi:hypothetical protein